MATVTIRLNGKPLQAEEGSTILEAAAAAGVRIPSLCYLKDQRAKANCRVCLVEIKGHCTLEPACAARVAEGMEIQTDTPAVYEARKTSLRLILSHHPIDCQSCVRLENSHLEDLSKELCSMCFYCDCVRDGDCELQKLAEEYEINTLDFVWKQRELPQDTSTASLVKNPNKCILCRRCVETCGEMQGMHVWRVIGRGSETQVTTAFQHPLSQTDCVECGQCVRSCPVGALFETQDYDTILDATADHSKTVTARVEPWFLTRYLRLAGLDSGTYGLEHLMSGLKRIGVDQIAKNGPAEEDAKRRMQEELLQSKRADAPLISALCPAAVRFVEKRYPALIPMLSKAPTPQKIFSDSAKKADSKAYTLNLSACSARKMEAASSDGVDLVMSPRELHRTFTRSGADPTLLPPVPFDPQAEGSNQIAADEVRPSGIEESVLDINGKIFRVAAAYGLKAAGALLDLVQQEPGRYDYIQLQSCPHGCISTGAWLK